MRIDSPIMTNAVGTGSFSGSFSGIHYGDGSNLTGVTSYTDADTLSYINSLNVLSGSDAYTTDVELNSSSSALISGYTNADTSLSSSLATALTSEYTSADTALSSSLATDIATNTAKVGYTDTLVKTKLNTENVVSGSTQILNLVSIDEDNMSSNSDTKLPTQQSVKNYVDTKVAALVDSAPGALDTLNELAAALGDDANFATTISNTIAGKVSQSLEIISGDGLTGGGNLTTTRTLAVGAGDGISVSADAVAVDGTVLRTTGDLVVSGSSQITISQTTGYTSFSSSFASGIASNLSAIQSNDSDISNLQTASGSFSTRVTTNENNISSLNTASGSFSTRVTSLESSLTNLDNTYATDAELNASSSALITAYGNADNALSSSLATALTSEYVAADTALSSSLAADIAVNTAKIGVTTETVRTAGALMDDEVDADIKTLSLPASTTISAFGKTLVDDADAATARTTLGVDAAGTDNSTDVSLTGAYDYITITGQTITRNQITNDDLEGSIANAKLANSSITINGSAVSLGGTRTLVTDDIAEDGSPVNLWYTDTRVKTKLNSDNVVSGSATQVRTFLNVENGADVTDTANVTAAGALMDSEVDADLKTFSLPANTTISTFGASLVDDANAATARTTLGGTAIGQAIFTGSNAAAVRSTIGVDAAGTDNSTNVTLVTTSHDYLSIAGQAITLGTIDISDDTNLAVSDTSGQTGINLTLSGDTISGVVSGLTTTSNVSFASVSTTGNVTVGGDLTVLGSRTELQVTSLNVEDKNILIASGAADSAAADGAGITIGGANETITWDHANSRFSFSDDVHVAGNITVTGTVDGVDIAALNTTVGNINTQVPAIYDNAGTPALNTGITEAEIKTLLNLEIGTDVQAYNSTLAAVAGGTYTGDDSITTVGTIGTGTWQGTAIASAYLDADTMHLGVAQSITANKTFNDSVKAIFGTGGDMEIYHDGVNSVIKDAGTGVLEIQTNGTEVQLTGNSGTDYMARFISNGAVNLYYDNSVRLATSAGGVQVTGALSTTTNIVATGNITGSNALVNGVITATGDIVAYYSSDERLKDNILEIPNALVKVESLRGVEFDWNDKQDVYSGHDLGVIAQEVEAVLPELVQTRDNGYKAVKYEKLTAVLIQAVKELSARVKELESK